MVFTASRGALPSPASLTGRDIRETEMFSRMERREMPPPGIGGVVLTDDYNPLDDFQRRLFVLWRQDVIRTTKGVLLFDGSEW